MGAIHPWLDCESCRAGSGDGNIQGHRELRFRFKFERFHVETCDYLLEAQPARGPRDDPK